MISKYLATPIFIFAILFFVSSEDAFSQKMKNILLTNGFLHIGNGKTMETGAIGIKSGKIVFVQSALSTSANKNEWDTIIDLRGQHVYPGFVAPNSTLGLSEIDAIRATRDFSDVGDWNPHVRAQIAFNVESKVIETVRTNGVLFSQATPRDGVISGTSSVMKLNGWNWEDATAKADDGIHLNWPNSLQGGGWWAEPAPKKQNEHYQKHKKEIEDFFLMAQAYSQQTKDKSDLRLEAMRGCFNGQKRVYFHAEEMQQLLDVLEFVERFKIQKAVIVGGYDAHLLGKRLKDANIPVMLPRVHSLPDKEEDPTDLPYRLPFLLYQQGIKFCLQNEGDMEAMNARNIPFLAGTAMAYGLPEEEAVRAVSLSACEILGIDQQYGSLEVGKMATLFVSKGPALDMRTNYITLILSDGQLVSTKNFQEELYLKYKKKYEQGKP
jgi:imidazolonepropionase-like amidohydrolase